MLASVLLGLVQGIAEFLPISSSGHLAILGRGEAGFGLYAIATFHMGTLAAIVAYYYRDLWSLLGGAVRLAGAAGRRIAGGSALGEYLETDAGARLALIILVASVATGVIGLFLKDLADYVSTPGHAKFVGAFFIITAVFVYMCDRLPIGFKGIGGASVFDAFVVGMFQGVAVLPGLSRSGLTIFAGVMRGVERRDAARLSFLMAVPAMIAAMGFEVFEGAPPGQAGPALAGAGAAFVSGYLSIVFLIRLLASRRLRYFAGYLVVLGLCTLIWLN